MRAEDRELWRRAMYDVAPLRDRPRPPNGSSDRRYPAGNAGDTPPVRQVPHPSPQPQPPLDRFAGLDRATAERLKRGQLRIEARLDLHGLTQAEAHRELAAFVGRSRAAGRRCVLVITGHGRSSGGILKEAVPRWLHEPVLRRHVLAIAPAQPNDGGGGALYVLLRRAQ